MPDFIHVQGGAALKRALARMGAEAAGGVAADAVNAAGEILLREARSRAPVRTGTLRDALFLTRASRSAKSSLFRKGVFRARIGARRRAAYAANVEFGHRLVRRGRVYGEVPPHQFMRPAYYATRDRLARMIEDRLWASVTKEWSA